MIRSREESASAGEFVAFLQELLTLKEKRFLALLRHKGRLEEAPDL
jgi:hypothetical protein